MSERTDIVLTLWRQDHPVLPWAYTVTSKNRAQGDSAYTLEDALVKACEAIREQAHAQ